MKNAFVKSTIKGLVLVVVMGLLAGRAEAQVWTPSSITVAAWYDAAE